jgi:hypothetical protein
MTYRMKPLSSVLTLVVCVGALHCGGDDDAAPTPGTGGTAGVAGKGGSGGTAGKGGSSGAGAGGTAGKGGSGGSSGKGGSGGSSGKGGTGGSTAGTGGTDQGGTGGTDQGGTGGTDQGGTGGTDQGGSDQGGSDQGGTGGTDQGGSDQGGSDQGGTGGTEQGGSDQGGSDQGGSDQGGAAGTGGDAGAAGDSGAGGAVVVGDFSVAVAPAAGTVVQGQTLGIDITITKEAPFDSDVTITFDNLPTGLTAPAGPIVIPAGQTTVHVDFTAAIDASVTTATVTVRAKADGGFDKTATFDATIQQAPDYTVSADQSALTIAAGNSATLNVTIVRVGGFADAVDVTFADLPAGVTASAATIAAGDTTVGVTISVDAGAATGTFGNITLHAKAGTADKTLPFSLKINPAVANITSAVPINAGDDGVSPFTDFRQGYTNVRIKIVGAGVAGVGVAGIRLGTLVPVSVQDKAGYTVAAFDLPHGESLGGKDISVTNITGTGTAAGVLTVTPIAVSNVGTDAGVGATGRGTPSSPFRTIAKANTVSDSGDTIQLLTNTHSSESYPITLKPGTSLEGVPSGAAGTTLPVIYKNGAAADCSVSVTDSASISKVRLSACEVQKNGTGLLTVNDVLANSAGDVGFTINGGEAKFACTDPTLACEVDGKKKAFVVAAGAKLTGAPIVRAASEIAFQIDGTADLVTPQILTSAPVAFAVTGSAIVKDGAFKNIGPVSDDATLAAFLISGDGSLTLDSTTASLRRRALLATDRGVANIGGSWTGPAGAGGDNNRYSIRLEGESKLSSKKLTSSQTSPGTDFLQLAGTGAVSIEDGALKSTTDTNRGIVGGPASTSAVTVIGTSFERFRSGAVVVQDTFGGTISIGAGSSFANGGVGSTAPTANFGALIDERTATTTAITIASGVQFGGTLVPAGSKDAASAPLFFGNPAVRIWYIPVADAAKITFQ